MDFESIASAIPPPGRGRQRTVAAMGRLRRYALVSAAIGALLAFRKRKLAANEAKFGRE
jgi:hypothetical protein